jgi:hypothetical protein
MRHDRKPAGIGNRSYQCQIANSLVCSLGIDGAIDACFRNGWTGTLSVILKDERNSQ